MAAFQGSIKISHSIPLLNDPVQMQGAVFLIQQHAEWAIVFVGIDAKDRIGIAYLCNPLILGTKRLASIAKAVKLISVKPWVSV